MTHLLNENVASNGYNHDEQHMSSAYLGCTRPKHELSDKRKLKPDISAIVIKSQVTDAMHMLSEVVVQSEDYFATHVGYKPSWSSSPSAHTNL